MAIPSVDRITAFNAIAATTTADLTTLFQRNLSMQTLLLEVVGEASANFTLDIQGRVHENGTFTNVDYLQVWQAGAAAFANAQLTVNDQTRRFYVVPNCPQFMQLVATRTAGGLTIHASFTSEVFSQWFATTARGSMLMEGPVASDAPATGNPLLLGIVVDEASPVAADEGDGRYLIGTGEGRMAVNLSPGAALSLDDARDRNNFVTRLQLGDGSDDIARLGVMSIGYLRAPDALLDIPRSAGDAAPAIGAMNVALIGGDQTLRASAAISQASGTAATLSNMGWVKSFVAHLDVTTVRTGGSSNVTLNVFIQTQLPSGDWQDIVHFTQISVSVTAEIVSWGPPEGNLSGIGVDGVAITTDRFFAEQDAGMTATNIRVMPLGDSLRIKWVYAAGDSTTGDYTFAVTTTFHS